MEETLGITIGALKGIGKFNHVANYIHEGNVNRGFWEGERNTGELLMLVVSELSEALEADRKGRHVDITKLEPGTYNFAETVKDTFEDEIADAIIRLFDLCGAMGIDIQRHVTEKLDYNASRPWKHGKQY